MREGPTRSPSQLSHKPYKAMDFLRPGMPDYTERIPAPLSRQVVHDQEVRSRSVV